MPNLPAQRTKVIGGSHQLASAVAASSTVTQHTSIDLGRHDGGYGKSCGAKVSRRKNNFRAARRPRPGWVPPCRGTPPTICEAPKIAIKEAPRNRAGSTKSAAQKRAAFAKKIIYTSRKKKPDAGVGPAKTDPARSEVTSTVFGPVAEKGKRKKKTRKRGKSTGKNKTEERGDWMATSSERAKSKNAWGQNEGRKNNKRADFGVPHAV